MRWHAQLPATEVPLRKRREVRFRLLAVASAVALVAVGIAAGATATTTAVPKLHGTIGPGYTISLKDAHGKKVKSLKYPL